MEKRTTKLQAENADLKARLEALEQLVKNRPYLTAASAAYSVTNLPGPRALARGPRPSCRLFYDAPLNLASQDREQPEHFINGLAIVGWIEQSVKLTRRSF